MKKLFYPLLMLAGYCYSIPGVPDYVDLAIAKKLVPDLLTCIHTAGGPTPDSQAKCATEFGNYNAALILLNNGKILEPNHDGYVSPFNWSQYDICEFQVGRLINDGIC